jgi:spermidine synthase
MVRVVALLLTVLTGFSGLVYEVTWQKYLATLLGSDSEATSAVLGIFLGGLAAGYVTFGRVTARVGARAAAAGLAPRWLVLYGGIEAAIGVWALLFPLLFRAVAALSVEIPHAPGGAGFALDVALTVLLIGPPTLLMGGTIPVLTQALARGLEDATRVHAWVYAFNTAGAFAGALAAGFVLIPWLGLEGVMAAMGAVNLLAGASFAALGRWARRWQPPLRTALAPTALPHELAALSGVAVLAGFSMMTIQTVLNRIGALALGTSQYTFSMLVAVFVLCIAIGSMVVSALPRIRPGAVVASQWLLVALLALLYPQIENAPYWAHVLRTTFHDQPKEFGPYHAAVFFRLLGVLAIPIGLSGALLPLLFHQLRREQADLGAVAGRLYGWNTLGSLFGALLGGYLLLFRFDLHHVFRIALGGLAVMAALLTARLLPRARIAALLLALVTIAGLFALPAWRPERLAAGVFRTSSPTSYSFKGPDAFYDAWNRQRHFEFYDDDPVTTATVIASAESNPPGLAIATNGKVDGQIPGDDPTTVLLAILPMLFAEKAESALVIGLGTGSTAAALARSPGMARVSVAEISPGVVRAAPLFDAVNGGVSKNPKIDVVLGDAYRTLRRSPRNFDVIVSEPSNPWVSGVEMLFSGEFLQVAKDHLAPGGVLAQWTHLYEMNDDAVALVLRTYASVFDRVAVWFGLGGDLILLGFDDAGGRIDLERVETRLEAPWTKELLQSIGITDTAGLFAHELLPEGVLAAARLEGDLHTLLHPLLGTRAARAFFSSGIAQLPPTHREAAARIGSDRSLLRRIALRTGGRLPDVARTSAVTEVCRYRSVTCATWLAAWRLQDPESLALASVTAKMATNPVLRDALAPNRQAILAQLLGASPLVGTISLDDARLATRTFARYYSHAEPLLRSTLVDVWEHCNDGGQGGCIEGQTQMRQELGAVR